ncbi:hypothetical protein NDU88_005745 [Pleurodeles waltl]|uniref:Uncharacterized protein n=1 Tax=Pleurodeles waltl TaxID=8319 RepID=A0AAV7UIX3_PLEWA|nr:hypothetical protein NDU88_005745 [Pleurodeles waltl]
MPAVGGIDSPSRSRGRQLEFRSPRVRNNKPTVVEPGPGRGTRAAPGTEQETLGAPRRERQRPRGPCRRLASAP